MGRPRRVLFLTLAFHPDSSATSILFTDMLARLAETGVSVTVLCGFPTKDTAQAVRELPRRETYRGITIVRCGMRLRGKASMPARALAYGSFLVDAGWRVALVGRRATVAGGTDPPFLPIALWLWSLVGRFQFQVLVFDLYPDGLTALGSRLTEASPVARIWRGLNRRAFAAASSIVAIGRDMAELLTRRYDVPPDRIRFIPHWAPEELDAGGAGDGSPLLAELGLQDVFVVQYSGNMGLWHDMDTIVQAASLLRDRSDIQFLLVGKGMRRANAERQARALDLSTITWRDFVPRDQLADTLTACDVALVSFRQGLEGTAVPSKLYGILAAGRPVIAQVPETSEVARTVCEEGCGVVVPPGDAEALAAAIRDLAGRREAVRAMGQRALAAYRARYTIAHAVERYRTLWNV